MAKYEYAEMEDFLKGAKAAGAKNIGVMVLVKNDDAGPVAVDKGQVVPGRRVSALMLLTSAARQKDGTEDHFTHQKTVLDEIIASEAEAEAINKRLDKEREAVYALVQKEQLMAFHGRVSA